MELKYNPALFASTLPKPHEPTLQPSFVKELAKPTQKKYEVFTNTFKNKKEVSKKKFLKMPHRRTKDNEKHNNK